MQQLRFVNVFVIVTITSLMLASYGCESSTQPAGGQLSMTSKYTPSAFPTSFPKAEGFASPLGVDSIKIARARFVLEEIEFEADADSIEFEAGPIVLEFNLSGSVQNVSVVSVPFGTYKKIEFDVHRVDNSDLTGFTAAQKVPFTDFLAGERYSIIIDGSVYKNGGAGESFQFRSKIDAEQEYDLLPELVVSETAPVANVTLAVSSAGWFKDSSGTLLDPTDSNNQSLIDENLKSSIRVFKDNDHDGERDD